ncbi:MAG: protein kinase [Acidobacteria bacterium]|nr:protein kinase [Acidobacteriota bacterium]
MYDRPIGSVLDGKYEILERLGGGGMGEIFLVRHLHLEQKRIVKILRRELAADGDAQKRFLREARLATQLKHPNVAILYDYSQLEDGSFYMVSEHIDGEDVGHWLEVHGPMEIPLALQLGIQALRGLEAIHGTGVIHRDISPDNLMITRDRRDRHLLKIIDLGLAKALGPDPSFEVTQAGTFMGKLRYCSPEQAGASEGENLDRRSDLYSFGLVLYEMITARTPFEAENGPGAVFKRLTEDPLPMVGRNPDVAVPGELDVIVRRALARDREHRYPDAIAFIEALEPLLEGFGGRPAMAAPAAKGLDRTSAGQDDRPRSGSLISRRERQELLAQIDRAARRMKETTRLIEQAESAAKGGQLDEAWRIASHIESSYPAATGLHELKELLEETASGQLKRPAVVDAAESTDVDTAFEAAIDDLSVAEAFSGPLIEPDEAAPGETPPADTQLLPEITAEALGASVGEDAEPPAGPEEEAGEVEEDPAAAAEAMVERYLKERKTALAGLALDALLELVPNHPRRKDFEEWVRLIRQEEEQGGRAQRAVEAGREALARGDFKAARKQFDVAVRNDPSGELAETFLAELEEAERDLNQGEALDLHRSRFEEALETGALEEAERQYERLADLGLARVTLTLYRGRLDAALSRKKDEAVVAPFERRIHARLDAEDFKGAREVTRELSEVIPQSALLAQIYSEVDSSEQAVLKRRSLEQGVQQFETFLAAGNTDGAALALRILRQMAPDDPRWQDYEGRLASSGA